MAAVEKLPAQQEKRDHAVKRPLGFLAGDARIAVSGRTRRFSENQPRGRFASPDRRVCRLPQPEVRWLRSHSTPMRSLSFSICLASAGLAACTYLRTAGPTAGEVIDQGLQDNQIRYDVVDIIRAPVARRGDRDDSDGEAGLGSERGYLRATGRRADPGPHPPDLFSARRHGLSVVRVFGTTGWVN